MEKYSMETISAKVDLNQRVVVTLTPAGINKLREVYGGLGDNMYHPKTFIYYSQLWDLMNVFGSMINPTFTPSELPFVDNEIRFIQ
jgi:hypothetical protein